MDKESIKNRIESLTQSQVFFDIPMNKYTSMKIGGLASLFVRVKSIEDLKTILNIVKEENIPIFVLGNGTNTIVKDGVLDKLILKIDMKDINILGKEDEYTFVEVYSGAQLKATIYTLMKKGLGPLHSLFGIPATIGGAIKMNAGAYEMEMKDIVYETTYMDYDGNIFTVKLDEHKFGYRESIFQHSDVVILKTVLKLKDIDSKIELEKANEIMQTRKDRQPLNYPNTGSIFKRGENFFASKEIDGAGLKGKQIGGMAVSDKHAGFIINKGNGTYRDFKELVSYIQEKVYENSGNKLELEVIIIGDE